ncbi:MAG TPA: sigma-70 family RNA polymerase sigma factor [Bacillales bacterium]|nr:sigma-70 family RNA polymerase sigma factor [Bacillales bacterium]
MPSDTFSKLFDQFHPSLYRYLYRMTGSRTEAEELLQETFIKAMVSLKVKNLKQARAWLYKVARNLYVDWVRKSSAEQRMVDQIKQDALTTSHRGNPETEYDKKEQQQKLAQIMQRLPERMRTVLYLREVEEFSYMELCETMELTMSQVKVTLHRSRERFRALAKEWEEE